MSNQEMQFADPDWKPSQQLNPKNDQQEQEVYTPQPINNEYREQNKWEPAPPPIPQQEGYTGLRPYNAPIPGRMQSGMYRQSSYRRRGRGLWFWIILAFIIFSLISGGSHFSRGFDSSYSPGMNQGPVNQGPVMGQPLSYKVSGQANLVINDQNANITVTEGQSNVVTIQAVNGNSFPGNPNDIQQSISQDSNTINANIPDSQDLLVTVPTGANLSLNTGSGTINIKGVAAQMTLITNDGTINAFNDTLNGSSTLQTNSGDINFEGTLSAGGNYQFITTSGTVSATLPTSPAFHVDATTNSGSINIPAIQTKASGTHVTGDVGARSQAQATHVIFKSDNGDITLNQK